MKSYKRFFILLILVTGMGCTKPVVEIDSNYVGVWAGYHDGLSYFVSIDSDGYGSYHRSFYGGSEGEEYWKGEWESSRTHIKIAQSPCFKIIEPPTPIDTNILNYHGDTATWELKLKYPHTIGYDGAEFTVFK